MAATSPYFYMELRDSIAKPQARRRFGSAVKPFIIHLFHSTCVRNLYVYQRLAAPFIETNEATLAPADAADD